MNSAEAGLSVYRDDGCNVGTMGKNESSGDDDGAGSFSRRIMVFVALSVVSPDSCDRWLLSLTMAQVEEIAKVKMPDLNTNKLQSAMNTVMGTAKNMGIVVVD